MFFGNTNEMQSRKVALYARVSTEHEAQVSALSNQLDWYKPIFEQTPQWKLIDKYVDEGITGTSAKKRKSFMRMIDDAKEQKFDLIITREVSRFARNTVDTLQYTRLLKEYGVEVYFLSDNIRTFDSDGELRLTIMATLAQDESRKTSVRVKAGQQTSMDNGIYYGNGNILGYDRIDKTNFVINPKQAETVKLIYNLYLSGMGTQAICYELERRGIHTATGKTKWYTTVVSNILQNTFYCGIITYHKQYTPDFLTQKKTKNKGVIELTRIKGTHTPIVTEEDFNKVQEIMNQRRTEKKKNRKVQLYGLPSRKSVWSRILLCSCGKRFNQHNENRSDHGYISGFQCYTSANKGSKRERSKRGLSLEGTCDSPYIPIWKLEMMAKRVFSDYINDTKDIVEIAKQMLEKHINDKPVQVDNTELLDRKKHELQIIKNKIDNLIEMRADGDIDKETFRAKKSELENQLSKLQADVNLFIPDIQETNKSEYNIKLSALMEKIEQYTAFQPDGDLNESVIEAFVKRIIVSKDEFKWYLRTNDKSTKYEDEDYENYIQVASFTITIDEAKAYMYAISPRKRVHRWFDLNVSIWV